MRKIRNLSTLCLLLLWIAYADRSWNGWTSIRAAVKAVTGGTADGVNFNLWWNQ